MTCKFPSATAICAVLLLGNISPAGAQISIDGRLLKDSRDLSQDEIRQLRSSVGRVDCERAPGRGIWSTGFLVGQAGLLVTTAHTFFDERGRDIVPLSRCSFSLPSGRTFQIDWTEARIGSRKMRAQPQLELDYVIARLRKAKDDSTEFLPQGATYAVTGPPIFMVSVPADQGPPKKLNELFVRTCDMKFIMPGARAWTNCTSAPGNSGAPILRRGEGGELSVVGLHTGRGSVNPNGFPSSATKAERNALSSELLLRGQLLDDLRDMMK